MPKTKRVEMSALQIRGLFAAAIVGLQSNRHDDVVDVLDEHGVHLGSMMPTWGYAGSVPENATVVVEVPDE